MRKRLSISISKSDVRGNDSQPPLDLYHLGRFPLRSVSRKKLRRQELRTRNLYGPSRKIAGCAAQDFPNPKRVRINPNPVGREPVTIGMPATQLATEPEFESLNPGQTEFINARYQSLIRLAESIRARRDPRELFDLLASELCRVVQFDAIAQYDEMANKVHWHVSEACSPSPVNRAEISKEETMAWWVYEHQQPVLIRRADSDVRFPAMMVQLRAHGMQSVCALPLSTAHRQLGSLVIASQKPSAYSEDEMGFFMLAASQIAVAIDDALNFQASRRAEERLTLLLDLTNQVVSNLDLRDLLRTTAGSIRRLMQCDGVGFGLPGANGRLQLYALDFPDGRGVVKEGWEPPVHGETGAERVLRTGQPLNLGAEDLTDEVAALAEGTKALCHLPLPGRDRVLGVLSLGRRDNQPFSQDEFEFLGQVAKQVGIAVENALAYGQIAELRDQLAEEKLYLEDEIRTELSFDEIVGHSDVLCRVLKEIETVAPTDSTVLIYGETGTGKELIARAVHNLSARKSGAFVKLNCAAIPTGLLESEMFGHERGAFTGAISQRVGRFELANRGTIFLDEIGEIPLELQPKLLRVLQEREFERLGSSRTMQSDARLIAATNRDLDQLVAEGKFRSDLYYRLNVFPVRVPALRERPEDIPLLVRHFVQQFSRRMTKTIDAIPAETMSALTRYSWPGNIRELQNVIERAVILTSGPVLRVNTDDLRGSSQPAVPASEPNGRAAAAPSRQNLRGALEESERQQILAALEASSWVVAGAEGAAARLGLKRSTLQSRMQKLGIRISRTVA
jgi:formate hydrogenlyase transcriptional activator